MRRHPYPVPSVTDPSPRFLSLAIIKRRDQHASPIEAAKGGGGGAKKNKKQGSNSSGGSGQRQQQLLPGFAPDFGSFMMGMQYPDFDSAHPVYVGSPPEVVVPDAIRRLQRRGGGLDSVRVVQALTQGLAAVLPHKSAGTKCPEGRR